MGSTNPTALFVTTVQTIKTARKITRISRITFKRIPCTCTFSTLGSYPYLQFVLSFCCLLMLTALTLVSNTVLHRFTSPLPPHCAVPQLQSPFTAPSTQTRCGMTVHLLLSTGIIYRLLHFLNILLCSSQCWISLSRNFCLTCSLDVRGFAGHHSTRFSCPLLQYFPENVLSPPTEFCFENCIHDVFEKHKLM